MAVICCNKLQIQLLRIRFYGALKCIICYNVELLEYVEQGQQARTGRQHFVTIVFISILINSNYRIGIQNGTTFADMVGTTLPTFRFIIYKLGDSNNNCQILFG